MGYHGFRPDTFSNLEITREQQLKATAAILKNAEDNGWPDEEILEIVRMLFSDLDSPGVADPE